jgi:plastocyanin
MRKTLLAVTFGVALMLAAVACSGGAPAASNTPAGSTSGGTTLNVAMSEMMFTPNTWTAKAGQPVTVNATNNGTVPHDWEVVGMESQTLVEAAAGKSASKTFTIATPGTYQVICSKTGHAAAGMTGTLTVQ